MLERPGQRSDSFLENKQKEAILAFVAPGVCRQNVIPNKAKDAREVTERGTVNAVKRHRKKKSPSAMACSRRRSARFLEKKSAGKQDLASPED